MKVNLYDFVFGDSFLSMTPKHEQQQQEKQVTQISSKLKTVVLQRILIKKEKRHATGENICEAHMWEENTIQNIYTTFTTQQ